MPAELVPELVDDEPELLGQVARACLKACGLSFFFTPARLPSSCRISRTVLALMESMSPVLSKCLMALHRVPVPIHSGAFGWSLNGCRPSQPAR